MIKQIYRTEKYQLLPDDNRSKPFHLQLKIIIMNWIEEEIHISIN